ncbi:sugar kinase [Alcanivorax hongdengensis A-11-3]|uniref:Sugar kinase n=1 Tax=Alcanivorax hongdengensis A-11-3 TaxID=1177179 RepID=L0WBD0_9GAMM|nr:FGGY-family carbohydrate kinase [Alcanivorax hongdengensis]EKF74078.1 sugar kinase [Alcanivorax hongdengensis A-11-3]
MGEPLLLALDQGTQSARAMLFNARGELVARYQQHIEPYFPGHPGQAEQSAGYFWDNLAAACQGLWQQVPELRERVVAAALTTQRASVVCLDRHMQPLRPAVIWLDQRRTDDYPTLPLWLSAPVTLLGQGETLRQFQSKAECNWLARQEPDIWSRTAHFLLLSGYLTYRLCGELRDCTASQVGYLPYDFKGHRWAPAQDLKWKALRVRREQLPELVAPGERLGSISQAASEATGIPAGLPLIACGADKACEVLGSGAFTPDIGNLSYGTTATFNTCNARYVEPIRFVPAYNAAVPGRYNSEIIVQRGYWMVNWFKREFGQQEVQRAAHLGVAPETLFEELLEQSPPGAMGLTLQPFWNPGVRIPGPEAKGAIIGFGDVHTRAHLYRAIIEGIAYALREGKERLEKRNRVPVRELRVSGGGSQSDVIMQITANIFGLPAVRPHTSETSGLGAAINAAVAMGLHPDYPTAVAAMTRGGCRFEPQAESMALYDALFRQVYSRLYPRLAPLYRNIRRITGYPAR